MSGHRLSLVLLADRLAVCRLDGDAPVPDWAMRDGFSSFTRTGEELSIVCREVHVPEDIRAERGWRAFGWTGSMISPRSASWRAWLPRWPGRALACSTFDTDDYLLVKEQDLGRAVEVLVAAGHAVHGLGDQDTGSGE